MGVVTASLASFVKLRLGIPGHAIILSVLPISAGLATVPRYGAGTVMSLMAIATIAVFRAMGLPIGGGPGAVTSMLAVGPIMDVVLARARGWHLHVGLLLAGLIANIVALVARGGLKLLSFQPLVGRPFGEWFRSAVVSYPLSGAAAGVICALALFRFTTNRNAG